MRVLSFLITVPTVDRISKASNLSPVDYCRPLQIRNVEAISIAVNKIAVNAANRTIPKERLSFKSGSRNVI